MHDLLLAIDNNNKVDLVWDDTTNDFSLTASMADTVRNNLILSLMIEKGELICDPEFGSRRLQARSAEELKRFDEEATIWIVSAGRALSVKIETEIDSSDATRINETVTAQLPGDIEVGFNTFLRVV